MDAFEHLTLLTGDCRSSPRSEVGSNTIAFIRSMLGPYGGALADTGWAVTILPTTPGGHVYDLSYRGLEFVRCWLAPTDAVACRLWPEAVSMTPCPTRPTAPWLAVHLHPDALLALMREPSIIQAAGDLERCVAWSLLPDRRD
jgi:hypothetical protein